LVVIGALLLPTQPSWSAELLSSYSYGSFYSASGQGTQFDSGSDSTTNNAPLSHTSALVPEVSVFVQSDFGVQKVEVTSARFGGGNEPFQGGGGQVNSRWVDTFVIEGGVGTGIATFQVQIDGDIQLSPLSSDPFAQIFLNAHSNTFGVQYNRTVGRGQTGETWQGTSFTNGILTREFEFTYGSPFTIQSDVNIQGQDGGLALFGSTVLAGFVLPSGATLATDSGASYAPLVAVPEPSSWLLTVSGLSILALALQRRRLRRPIVQ